MEEDTYYDVPQKANYGKEHKIEICLQSCFGLNKCLWLLLLKANGSWRYIPLQGQHDNEGDQGICKVFITRFSRVQLQMFIVSQREALKDEPHAKSPSPQFWVNHAPTTTQVKNKIQLVNDPNQLKSCLFFSMYKFSSCEGWEILGESPKVDAKTWICSKSDIMVDEVLWFFDRRIASQSKWNKLLEAPKSARNIWRWRLTWMSTNMDCKDGHVMDMNFLL